MIVTRQYFSTTIPQDIYEAASIDGASELQNFTRIALPLAKPILAVGGAIGGCLVDFVYPALLWYLFFKPSWTSLEFILIALLGLFGLVTGVISTYQAILDVIKAFKSVKN